jgi:hypothetical protein
MEQGRAEPARIDPDRIARGPTDSGPTEPVPTNPVPIDSDRIDPDRPWLEPLRSDLSLLDAPDWRAALSAQAAARRIVTAHGLPARFVEAGPAVTGPRALPYERQCADTGCIPSRDNLHDRFNALVWLAFPRAKQAVNAVQAAEIGRLGVSGERGRLRDLVTRIDENGLFLVTADAAVFEALRRHDWEGLLLRQRTRWGQDILPLVFGHGLLEQLQHPHKGLTAVVLPLLLPLVEGRVDRGRVDAAAAAFIRRPTLAREDLLRLPVLGIPGWAAANAAPAFYADPSVFRPPRPAEAGS